MAVALSSQFAVLQEGSLSTLWVANLSVVSSRERADNNTCMHTQQQHKQNMWEWPVKAGGSHSPCRKSSHALHLAILKYSSHISGGHTHHSGAVWG